MFVFCLALYAVRRRQSVLQRLLENGIDYQNRNHRQNQSGKFYGVAVIVVDHKRIKTYRKGVKRPVFFAHKGYAHNVFVPNTYET